MTPGENKALWYKEMAPQKIFGIGLTKTGTSSLAFALKILGYTSIHYPWSLDDIDNHEASTDIPVSCRYKELDIMYPNSKFILTTRPFEDWITTTERKPPDQFKPPLWKIETRIRMYGSIHWDKKQWSATYYRHQNEVREHFKNKNNYLEIDLEEKDKWSPICSFLNKDKPLNPYPKMNKTIFRKKIY